MKSLLDFIPLFVFYYLLKTSDPKNPDHPLLNFFGYSGATSGNDILVATAGLIISTILVYGSMFLYQKFKFDKQQWMILLLTVVMGGLTLLLRDPTYIKLKAVLINVVVAGVFLLSPFASKTKEPLARKMFEPVLVMTEQGWKYLNYAWVGLYLLVGALHVFFAFLYADGKYWGEFTVFGDILVCIVFIVLQFVILRKNIKSVVDKNTLKEMKETNK